VPIFALLNVVCSRTQNKHIAYSIIAKEHISKKCVVNLRRSHVANSIVKLKQHSVTTVKIEVVISHNWQ